VYLVKYTLLSDVNQNISSGWKAQSLAMFGAYHQFHHMLLDSRVVFYTYIVKRTEK